MANIVYNSYGSLATRHDGWNDMTDEAWSIWDQADWSAYEYTMGDTDCAVVLPVSSATRICLRGTTNLAVHYRIIGYVVLVLLGSSVASCAMGRSSLSMKLRIACYDDRLTFVPKRGRRLSGTPPPSKYSKILRGGDFLMSTGQSATLCVPTTRLSSRVHPSSRCLVFREAT